MSNEGSEKSSGKVENPGCLSKLPLPLREVFAALLLRPQNYWQTEEMMKSSLNELGFEISDDGKISSIDEGKNVDLEDAKERGKDLLA